jgi:CheY-like chemotaxis protein
MLLRLEGYAVASAPDGRAGLQSALEYPPDVILSDVNMPYMNGYQLLAAVRSHPALNGTRMVLLNAEVDAVLAARAGCDWPDACLGKPFTREQLLKVLASVRP